MTHRFVYGAAAFLLFFLFAAKSRGEMPEGQLGSLAVLLILVILGIASVLDRLYDIEKRLNERKAPKVE